jgi:hypothetical protein
MEFPAITMQFTSQELKLTERLRKEERLWPRTRWVLLGMGVCVYAVWGYVIFLLFDSLNSKDLPRADQALMFAFIWPTALLVIMVGSMFVALATRHWRGNVQRMLLLKLLDAEKESRKDRDAG